MNEQLKLLLPLVCALARETGQFLLQQQASGAYQVASKSDDSPVTTADFAASDRIIEGLVAMTPNVPVLTEEALQPWSERQTWQRYWLVDPLDGTQEFILGSEDFAVSIAYIEANQPVLGVIYWPAKDALYYAAMGCGAFRKVAEQEEGIQVRSLANPEVEPITIALSRRQPVERILSKMQLGERDTNKVHTGSCALKSCLIAEGSADCFLRVGETGEWDTAAAQVIVEEAGGRLVAVDFNLLDYNRTQNPTNPDFLVLGDQSVPWPQIFPYGKK